MAMKNPQEMEENAGEMQENAAEGMDEDDIDGMELPFPRATIVNMLRQHLTKGKQIKGQVKTEMNIWLGKMVQRMAEKMNSHPYTYVDGAMFREAIEPYENIQDIEKEKERLIKQLEAIKAACDVLVNEVDKKFALRQSFAYDYQREFEEKKKQLEQQK